MTKESTDLPWAAVFETQMRTNSRLFFQLAYDVLRNGGDAEDVCQQAMLKAWERRSTLASPDALRAWLTRTVLNESLQLLRRRKIEARVAKTQAESSPGHSNEPKIIDRRQSILHAIQKLPDTERDVVMLRMIRELSGGQTSRLLGCSEGEVSKQLHQGLERLRKILAAWMNDPECP